MRADWFAAGFISGIVVGVIYSQNIMYYVGLARGWLAHYGF